MEVLNLNNYTSYFSVIINYETNEKSFLHQSLNQNSDIYRLTVIISKGACHLSNYNYS